MGATINLDYDKLLKEIEQDKLRAQAQAQQFKAGGFTGQAQQFGQQQSMTPPPVQPQAQAQAQQFKAGGFTGQAQQFGQQHSMTPPPVQPQAQAQPQQQKPAYNPPIPPQYANEPRQLAPLPPLPGSSPINRPTAEHVNQQFNQAAQYDNDPLPF